MKKVLFLSLVSLLLFSCKMNPSKEARIQKLESAIQIANEKIEKIEQDLESKNVELQQILAKLDK